MATIRRTLGGFALAAVIAAGLVLMPAQVHAGNGNGNNSSSTSFCDSLRASIAYIDGAIADGDFKAALLAPLESAFRTYCEPQAE